MFRKKYIKILFFLLTVVMNICYLYLIYKDGNIILINKISRFDYKVENYDKDIVTISVNPHRIELGCTYNDKEDYEFVQYNKCYVVGKPGKFKIKFRSPIGFISNEIIIKDYYISNNIKDTYYLPTTNTLDFNGLFNYQGKNYFKYVYNPEILEINDNVLKPLKDGFDKIKIYYKKDLIKEVNIYISRGIVNRPNEFDYKKKHLKCGEFTEEENDILDDILEDRVNKVGLKTRAGVVEAGRFLTLDFKYRISYFFENGRVSDTSPNHADGEGRYYKKGLYLDESRYKSITKKFVGPATWGCNLTNFEPRDPPFAKYAKVPNGLDCSGFVSWAILNGGFDVGDIGAGESEAPNQLTDKGKFTRLTKDLIESGNIRVGDLFNYPGHIALLIGEDEQHYYIAESLPHFDGLIAKKYEKTKVNRTFPYVVLMDEYYQKDGNITNMWY